MLIRVSGDQVWIDNGGYGISYEDLYTLTGSMKLWNFLKGKTDKHGQYRVELTRRFNGHGIPKLLAHPVIYREDEVYHHVDGKSTYTCTAMNDKGEVILSPYGQGKLIYRKNNEQLDEWTLLE